MSLEVKNRAELSELAFKEGDVIVFGARGLYQVERLESMTVGESTQRCYVLKKRYSETIHKTYLPEQQVSSNGIRQPLSVQQFDGLSEVFKNLELSPESVENNSNKKMISYDKRIVAGGFDELVRVYFCVKYDIETTGRADKRYVQYMERLRLMMSEEIAFAKSITVDEAQEIFDSLAKLQTSH